MTLTTKPDLPQLEVPATATRTSDFEISDRARNAMAAALERVDDLQIALEIRVRDERRGGDRMELEDFIREQGYDP